MNRELVTAAAVVVSLLAAFFLVFAGLFSDGPERVWNSERLVALGLVAVVLGGATFGGAHWGRGGPTAWSLIGALPSLFFVALTWPDQGTTAVWVAYLVVVVGATLGGGLLGSRRRQAHETH